MNLKLGSKMSYSNIMYSVAGEAAANVEGTLYEKVVETKVLKPLGLTNTGFSPMEMKNRPNYSMPFFAASFKDAQEGSFTMAPLDEIYMTRAPAGDMYSNVLDLVRWGKAVMNNGNVDGKQVLNKESMQEILKPHSLIDIPEPSPEFGRLAAYCLGWGLNTFRGRTVYAHGKLGGRWQLVNDQ